MSSQPNKSLADGLQCLQALATSAEPIGCRELARRLGMNATRVNRLLMTLAEIGLARRDDDRRYLVGPGIHVLAAQSLFGSGLIRNALPVLEAMSETGLSVAMGMLWRDQVSYLYHATPGMPSAEALGRIGLYPAAESSIGLAILAQKTEPEVTALYRDDEVVRDSITQAREKGYADIPPTDERPEHNIAVSIDAAGTAAVGFFGIPLDQDLSCLVSELKQFAEQITLK